MHRNPNPKPIKLTERVIDILDILYRHRIADTGIFTAALKGSDQRIRKGLTDIWDNGYIDRPAQQWMMHQIHKDGQGRSDNIYALTDKGVRILAERGYKTTKTELKQKNKQLGETTIFHDLVLTRMWACLKVALEQKAKEEKHTYGLVFWYQDRPDREQLKTEIALPNNKKIVVIPDSAFMFQRPQGQHLFFVEYYRTRKKNHQTYLDKLKLYNLYHQQNLHQKYRTKNFRVITLVPTRAIITNLLKLINTKKENKELRHFRFWFTSEEDWHIYHKERVPNQRNWKATLDAQSILKAIFRTPVSDKLYRLEDSKP